MQAQGYSTDQIINAIFGADYIDKLSSSIPEEELRAYGTQTGLIKPGDVQRNSSVSGGVNPSGWTGFRK